MINMFVKQQERLQLPALGADMKAGRIVRPACLLASPQFHLTAALL